MSPERWREIAFVSHLLMWWIADLQMIPHILCACGCVYALAWAWVCSEAPEQCVFLASLPPGCAWIKWTIPEPAVTTHTPMATLLYSPRQLGPLTLCVSMFLCMHMNSSVGPWLTHKVRLEMMRVLHLVTQRIINWAAGNGGLFSVMMLWQNNGSHPIFSPKILLLPRFYWLKSTVTWYRVHRKYIIQLWQKRYHITLI